MKDKTISKVFVILSDISPRIKMFTSKITLKRIFYINAIFNKIRIYNLKTDSTGTPYLSSRNLRSKENNKKIKKRRAVLDT